jgi:glutathione S-transferase
VIDDDGFVLADSNAILVYLAKRHGAGAWLPEDARGAAAIQRWLSVAAGPLVSGPATARLITVFGADHDPAVAIERSQTLLHQLDAALTDRSWLVGERPSIADVALYTYVAHAPEGNVSLDAHARVRAWLARLESLHGFVPMQPTAVGLRRAA